jgi:hypothetical protein
MDDLYRLRCIKRRLSESQTYVDDIPVEKDGSEYYGGDEQNVDSQIPQLYQVRPILTVSEVVSSVKQSLEDLGNVITPHRWSAPKQMVDQETQVKEPNDLFI